MENPFAVIKPYLQESLSRIQYFDPMTMLRSQNADEWIAAETKVLYSIHSEEHEHIDIITIRDNILRLSKRCLKSLDEMDIGIHIHAIHLTEVNAPAPVQDAYLDVISAQEDSEASMKKAEAYHAEAIPIALGQAAAIVQKSHGDAINIESQATVWTALFAAHHTEQHSYIL